MEHIELYESFNQRTMIIRHRNFGEISVELQGSQIMDVVNNSNVMFPFGVGSSWNRSIETWACNNKFKIDGEDPCPEEKIFGMRAKDIPMGHELRLLYPHKFRK